MRTKSELLAVLKEMAPAARRQVMGIADEVRKVINKHGHAGHMAALWVAIEVLEQTEGEEDDEGGRVH